MKKGILIALASLFVSSVSFAVPQLRFEYQELAGEYERYSCQHKKNAHRSYLVWCQKGSQMKKYRIHLSVTRYPKTVFGSSGYEILYWITDLSNRLRNVLPNDSVTVWVHNSEDNNLARAIELRQGIENDVAQLNLYIRL